MLTDKNFPLHLDISFYKTAPQRKISVLLTAQTIVILVSFSFEYCYKISKFILILATQMKLNLIKIQNKQIKK